MIGGSLAGIMHGSFRRDGTSQYLSISMPNTFSMSPSYVKKFIEENQLAAPDQDVFECLRDKLARLYLDAIDGPDGRTFMQDASVVADSEVAWSLPALTLWSRRRHTCKSSTTELPTGFVCGFLGLTRSAVNSGAGRR